MAKVLPPAATYTTKPGAPVATSDMGERAGLFVRSLLSLATIAFVGSWLGFYLITLWPSIALNAFAAILLLHIVTGSVIVPYLVSLVWRRRLPGGSALDAAVVGAIAAYLLATATSLNWRVSLESVLITLTGFSVFFVLSDAQLFKRRNVEIGVMLAALAASVWALVSVVDVYRDYLDLTRAVNGDLTFSDYVPPTVPRVEKVGDHTNILAMTMAMALPFFVAGIFRKGDAPARGLSVVGLPVVLLALFFTLSRGAWAGAALGAVFTLVAMVTVLPRGRALLSSARGFVRNRLALIVALAAIAGVAFASTVGVVSAMRWESRPEWLFRDSASPRRELLSTGFEVFADYPILGTGPDVFGLLYPEYSGENPRYHFHVHNGFLQAAIDSGIPGIVAMVALGGTFSWMTMSRLRRASPQTQLTLIAATGGLLAFAAHSMVDAPNEAKSLLAMLGALGAIAALAARDADVESDVVQERWRLNLRRAGEFAVRAFVPIAMAGLLITWVRLDFAHYEYSNSLGDANAHRWGQSAEHVRHAVELDPNFAIYRFQYGSVLARDYLQTDQPALLNEAVAQLNRGLQLEPRSAIGHTNLALLYADIGQREEARDEAFLAIKYANSDPSVLVAAAYALEQTGWEEEAVQAYGQVIFYNAGLADSPFWGGTTFRQRNFENIIGSSAIIFNACSLLDLSNHDAPAGPFTRQQALDACGQYVIERPRDLDARVVLAEALVKSDSDHEESRALLDDVLHRQPDFAPALTAMGSWYRAQGDTGTARDYWLRAGQLNQTDALVLLGDSYPANAVPRQVVNALQTRLDKATSEVQFPLTSILYYRRSFYRESPVDILLPGDWQTAVPGRFARAYDALDRWIPAP